MMDGEEDDEVHKNGEGDDSEKINPIRQSARKYKVSEPRMILSISTPTRHCFLIRGRRINVLNVK